MSATGKAPAAIASSSNSFDQFVIVLKNTVNQMVYKHAISTVVPARQVRVPMLGGADGEANEDGPGNNF